MRDRIFVSMCILAIVAGCIASNRECPPQQDIEPCSCGFIVFATSILCSNMTSTENLYAVFQKSGDFPFSEFVLKDCNLMYLPSTAVKRKEMQGLTILNSIMTSIFESKPDASNSLQTMRLVNSRFQKGIEWEFFSSFKKLQMLDIRNVEVKKIGKLFKDNINNEIDTVRILDGKTAVLEDGVFQALRKMSGIEIRNSIVKTLKRSMFAAENVLTYFDFSGNQIKSLPDDMFSNMPYLTHVRLDRNRLTILPAAVYADISKRHRSYITFLDNPLTCDCSLMWIFGQRATLSVIHGTCDSPPSKKGKMLFYLTRYEFPHC